MYTTSLKTWARSVAIDGIIIAALVAGVIYHMPYALAVSVFFMWWISVLGIIFGLLGETLEITVKATNRDCYAQGALAAAKFLVGKPPKLYGMPDVLGLSS